MNKWALILFFLILSPQLSYSQYKSFSGGIQFGLGTSSAIDLEHIWNYITCVPFQAGFIVEKEISRTQYLELGLIYAKHSSRFLKLVQNNGEHLDINLFGTDFPIIYHFKNMNPAFGSHPYFGLIPTWVIYNSRWSNSGPDVLDESFRDMYMSLCSGICINKNNVKIKVQLSIAITSAIKKDYSLSYPCESSKCGGRFYPVELLFCYMIKVD